MNGMIHFVIFAMRLITLMLKRRVSVMTVSNLCVTNVIRFMKGLTLPEGMLLKQEKLCRGHRRTNHPDSASVMNILNILRISSVHKQLVCSLCSPLYHKICSTGSVEDFSKAISSSETDDLYDIVSDIMSNLESSLTAVESDIDDLYGQKTIMLQQAQELYDKIVSKAKKWFDDGKSEIDTHYQSQLLVLKQNHTKINNTVHG